MTCASPARRRRTSSPASAPSSSKLRADALVVSDPHAVAWAFNIRGADVAHTPLPLAFAIMPQAGRPALYVDGRKLSNDVRDRLEGLADVREPADFVHDARSARRRARKHRAARSGDRRRCARAPGHHARRQGRARRRSDRADEGGQEPGRDRRRARGACARRRGHDALPRLVRSRGAARHISPRSTRSQALESFRRDTGLLKDISFPTISGAGPDGAIVHYRVTSSDQPRRSLPASCS